MSKNEIATITNSENLPSIIPDEMDKKSLFNAMQDTKPIAELSGKKFKILGIIPEIVKVPKNRNNEDIKESDIIDGEVERDIELVDRQRLIVVTNMGSYHSFSITFQSALMRILNLWKMEFKSLEFEIIPKTRGSGRDVRAYYVVKVV